jgi:hypothetical protein
MTESTGLVLGGGFGGHALANPTNALMAVNHNDHIICVFWAAFLLFSWTAASIVSGAVIERITTFAFGILAIAIGSVFCNRCFMGMAF